MRDVVRAGGTVVAAVVAVLEKQAVNPGGGGMPPVNSCSGPVASRNRQQADEKFESAVKDFDSVACDVERISAAAAAARMTSSSGRQRVFNENGVTGRSRQYQDEVVEFSSSDEGSSGQDSESEDEEDEEHGIEGLETIAEEERVNSALSYKGTRKTRVVAV